MNSSIPLSTRRYYLQGKKVAITGGTGFIGSHLLTEVLKHKPTSVHLISRGSSTSRINQHLKSIHLSVYNSQDEYIQQIFDANPEYLFILGGNADPRLSLDEPRSDLEHNLLYNFRLLEALNSAKKYKTNIVFMSSVAVYGESNSIHLNENSSATNPRSPYGINKLAMEGYLRFYCEQFGLKGFSIRLFSTYGPMLYKQVVYDFANHLLENPDKLHIRGDGSEIRDLSYIDDQINGLLLLAQKGQYKGETYNLGSGEGISVSDLALKIASIIGVHPKIEYQLKRKEKHHGHIWIADTSKTKHLGHFPKINIDDGLKKTILWIKKK